ncbi:hypothetical protein V9T40_005706 [Parthenolecanium corni]|uniref:Uncharacterized protein n=1 Tax=Parthenolecanium corni TaxID=536013 RepID=A0AAN9YBA3_9HEMI
MLCGRTSELRPTEILNSQEDNLYLFCAIYIFYNVHLQRLHGASSMAMQSNHLNNVRYELRKRTAQRDIYELSTDAEATDEHGEEVSRSGNSGDDIYHKVFAQFVYDAQKK